MMMAKDTQPSDPPRATRTMARRELLTRSVPACAAACMGAALAPEMLAALAWGENPEFGSGVGLGQETHKFDETRQLDLSNRTLVQLQNGNLIALAKKMRDTLGFDRTVEVLNDFSTDMGLQAGARQAQRMGSNDFSAFVSQFRPPNFAKRLTHEVVEDTDTTFQIKVTECVWAEVFRAAGMAGELGHAAVCQMDYHTPVAFNPKIRMERTKTLMQGQDCCNHRYILSP